MDRTLFIERYPTAQTVYLGGNPINLSALSEAMDVSNSYLSLIFRGKRSPSIRFFWRLADSMNMTMDDLWHAIEAKKRVAEKDRKWQEHRDLVAS